MQLVVRSCNALFRSVLIVLAFKRLPPVAACPHDDHTASIMCCCDSGLPMSIWDGPEVGIEWLCVVAKLQLQIAVSQPNGRIGAYFWTSHSFSCALPNALIID
jgi:hypothetical protein